MEDVDLADTTYQYRSSLDQNAIADYASVNPDDFTQPIELLAKDGDKYVILSGHHRVRAFQKAGRTEFSAYIHKGLQESEALMKALQANSNHGVRVTVADKKAACQKLLLKLQDEGRSISNSRIARCVGLSDPTVENYRKELVDQGKLKEAETRQDSAGRDRPAKNRKKPKPGPSPVEVFKSQIRALAEQASQIDTSELTKLSLAQRRGMEAELNAYCEDIRKVIDTAGAAAAPQAPVPKPPAQAA
jgi:hypothetical protein